MDIIVELDKKLFKIKNKIIQTHYILNILNKINIFYIIATIFYIILYKKINKNLSKIIIIIIIMGIILLSFNIYIKNEYNKENIINKYVLSITDDNYKVFLVKNLLSDQECDLLLNNISLNNNLSFVESEVVQDGSNKKTDYRKSKQVWLNDNDSPVSKKITEIAKIFTGLPEKNMEDLQVVEYDISGYFNEHYDPDTIYDNSNIKDRAYTLLFYLNNVEEGGETFFNKLNLKITPSKGDAIFFKSLNQDTKELLLNSLHQGMVITKGKKIICNKWIHLNEFTPKKV